MIRIAYGPAKQLLQEKGYTWNPDGRMNIVGYRNKFGRVNYYDDTISLYYGDYEELHFSATTRPGTPHLLKPVNYKGAAILVPGQYKDKYSLGLHRGKYLALIQSGQVSVYRDNTHDDIYDTEERTIETGYFGINIHRASIGAKVVGPDSAGCQVIQSDKEYNTFIQMCVEESRKGFLKFTYTLVEL